LFASVQETVRFRTLSQSGVYSKPYAQRVLQLAQPLKLFLPARVKCVPELSPVKHKSSYMLRNYFKTAWKNLTKNKVFSLINILGLTIGITVCMMIFLFIMNEFSVDNFPKNEDHIYLTVFAGLAILVACLGLFGLASFTATKRLKEIGVRKVLGSSVSSIVMLLSKDLLKPVIIAACIALPAGYWAMNKWLQNFAYKTTLSWWIFVLAALITFGIALMTVCIKAIKAAIANPVKSLRTE